MYGHLVPIHAPQCCFVTQLSGFQSIGKITQYDKKKPWVYFSCDQAVLWMVHRSVRLSVRHTFLTMFPSSYHHEIFRNYYHWQKWCPCKKSRSKVKVTELKTQFNHFRTVTPVWIHMWWWNCAQSLMLLRGDALLLLKVIRQIWRSRD